MTNKFRLPGTLAATGLVAALAMAPFGGSPPKARTTSAAASTSPILLYAQDWNTFPKTRSQANWKQVALNHAVLVGSPGGPYKGMIPQLHAWNPTLKALVYDLGPYTIKGGSEYNTLMAQHPSYFARTASGQLITVKAASGTPAFPNNTLMDEGNPGWQAEEGQRIKKNIAAGGFDGAYVDSLGPGVFTGTTTGIPVDPRTKKVYTKVQWMQFGAQAMNAVKTAIGSDYLMATGLVNGAEYQTTTHYLADSNVTGMQTDSWLRVADSSPTSYPSASTLAANLQMVQSLQAKHESFFGWTKIWTNATPSQTAAWNTYALAAYLLVSNGINDYYGFNSPFDSDRTNIFFSDERAALGKALGNYTLSGGVYKRSFQSGSVTLNTNNNVASINVS